MPAEQVLRDMRINRIFEGPTEIIHLLIAREAVDAHLAVAGDLINPDADTARKARAAATAGRFYGRWLPTLVAGKGQLLTAYTEFGPRWPSTCGLSNEPAAGWPAARSTRCPAGRVA